MNSNFHIVQGKAYWAKILGEAQTNSFGEKQWEMDLALTPETKAAVLALGVSKDRIKEKEGVGEFITFKRRAVRKDGTPAAPISVVDNEVNPWDTKTLIGNGSLVNVRFALNNRKNPRTGKDMLVPSVVGVQVVELVPYQSTSGFKPVNAAKKSTRSVEETWGEAEVA